MLGGRRLVTCDGAWVEAEAALQAGGAALYFAARPVRAQPRLHAAALRLLRGLVDGRGRPRPSRWSSCPPTAALQEMLEFMQAARCLLALPFHDPYRRVSETVCVGGAGNSTFHPNPSIPRLLPALRASLIASIPPLRV